jgi:thiamine biosynthesis lipoprotein
MGVQVRLVLYTKDEDTAKTAAKAAFARVADLEDVMSDYQRDSELMRLCRAAGSGPVTVSAELFKVLDYARKVSEASEGAFDVTIGPVVALWRESRRNKKLPDATALAETRSRVGWRLMKLDRETRSVDLTVPGMRLDLGGIAKGYAGDEAIRVMRGYGVDSALFEAGGDIVVSAPPPGKRGWEIETEDGRKLTLSDAAVSTSGHTEQFVEIDGVRYSHIVDPRTGLGLTSQYAATVTARRGITTDALATAATLLGPEDSKPLVKRFGARAWVRIPDRETTSRQGSTTSRAYR